MIGKTILHYKIISKLGEGGMGVVYKAEDTKLDRMVAIKVLPSAALASEDDRARFYREAKAAAQLHHPNIASVFEIDDAVPSDAPHGTQPSPFIAMEFIEGKTLDTKIREGPLKLDDAVRIARDIASALEAAHEKDIVHRDIKSQNVMLTAKGSAKVLDFGLAKTAHSAKLTKMGSTLGTLAYMSPEQARGEPVDHRSDLWSLGIVLYEMIAGKNPFPGDYEQAAVYSILNEDPIPLTALRTGVPMELEHIVNRCLSKEKASRFQSATDLIAALSSAPTSLATSKYTSAVQIPATRGKRRFSFWILTAAALGVIAGVLMTWFYLSSGSDSASSNVVHVGLPLPDSVFYSDPSWSPDGTSLLFTAKDGTNKNTYIAEYDLSTGLLTALTDEDGSYGGVYSPDGKQFYSGRAGDRLVAEAIDSGVETVVSTNFMNTMSSMTWLDDGRLVYQYGLRGLHVVDVNDLSSDMELSRESWSGGKPASVPGQDFVFYDRLEADIFDLVIYARDVVTGQLIDSFEPMKGRIVVGVMDSDFLIMRPYYRGLLEARSFNASERRFSGPAVGFFEVGQAAVSRQGHLLYLEPVSAGPVPAGEVIYHIDENGLAARIAGPEDIGVVPYNDLSLSPDGKKFIIEGSGLQLIDTGAGSAKTLVDAGSNANEPFWSRDGQWIYFQQAIDSTLAIFRIRPDGSDAGVVVGTELNERYPSVSSDGTRLLFTRDHPGTGRDIILRDLNSGEDSDVFVANGPQTYPEISPDGNWVAYITGDEERLVVASIHGRETISLSDGSTRPHWAHDGQTLFYRKAGPWRIVQRSFDFASDNLLLEARFGPELTFRTFQAHHIHYTPHPGGGIAVSLFGLVEEELKGRWKVIFNWASTLDEVLQ